jgi:hypothetical protein
MKMVADSVFFRPLRGTRLTVLLLLVLMLCGASFGEGGRAFAATATECTVTNFCYCINTELQEAIERNVTKLREMVQAQRNQGKAIGYLSVPISTVGGAYFGVNVEIAEGAKQRIEKRFGAGSAWILNPAMKEASLPAGASGADYMLMWTRVLEGPGGLGEDFDFVYFAGPTDFASFFSLTGDGDMDRIAAYFDSRFASDPSLRKAVGEGKTSRTAFRNYYALRASVAFSNGSHDEWALFRILNERRRGSERYGIAGQLPLLFDGKAVSPGSFESPVSVGYVGRCLF